MHIINHGHRLIYEICIELLTVTYLIRVFINTIILQGVLLL